LEPAELLLHTAKFDVVRTRNVDSNGCTQVRETIVHPGAVVILPLLDDGGICLIRNRRPAVDATLLELPAGTLESGESPSDAAHRELAEETGFTAGRMEPLIEFWMSPGILRERMHLFAAAELSPGEARPMADENIENLIVAWDEAIELVRTGAIQDAKSIVGLLYYDRFRDNASPTRLPA
jgi:ADP-ribose pyrophosphatase